MKHLLLLLALLLPAIATAYDFEVDGINYSINGNEATVTSISSDDCSDNISIPYSITYNNTTYTVTAIGEDAFGGCESLTSITIPNSVTTIGSSAFSGCIGLANIEIPNSVTTIGIGVFYGCTGLTSVIIGNSVATIGPYAFGDCTGLTIIEIPNSVTTIGEGTFSGCSKLTNVTLGDALTAIESWTFSSCRDLASIIIPNSVNSIGDWAFYECSGLTNVTIGNSVTTIGEYAFSGCSSLTNVIIPDSVTHIYHSAFESCRNLNCVSIGKSVTYIGSGAFCYNGLDTVNYNAISCSDFEFSVFSYELESNISIINIGDSVLTIPGYFALGLPKLKNINIPNLVTCIGKWAFTACGLTSVTIGNSVTSIGEKAFSGTKLTSINIPNSVTHIGEEAFSGCNGLSTIEIPNSVTAIDNSAFSYCSGLRNVTIGNSVTTIGYRVFAQCDSLDNVYCYATTPAACDDNTFSNYSGTLHVPAASLAAYFTAPVWSNFENIVGDAVAPTGISINKDSVEIQLGEQLKLTATVTPADASFKEITWISTNEAVATVDNGTVTTVGNGECDIIAICFGMQAKCHVSVVNRITLDQQEAMLLPNHMLVLTPNAPVMPEEFTVNSSDPTVAAARVINGKVQVVGIKEGTAIITVSATEGTAIPATCLVTVYTEPGDANCDGFVNISDVTDLIDYLLGSNVANFKTANADLDNDGKISIGDVTALIDVLLSSN